MRLASFKIGSDRSGDKQKFKNLKNVCINFDEEEWITLVIGWNGTGKSNVLEALVIVFRNLIGYPKKDGSQGDPIDPEFSFIIEYHCHGKYIQIDADPDREKDKYQIKFREPKVSAENNKGIIQANLLFEVSDSAQKDLNTISFSEFKKHRDEFLPKYVFGYYSGHSNRMEKSFLPYLKKYDEKLRNAKSEDPGLRRLFYALPVHSQFVLLAFIIRQDELIRKFLDTQLGLDTNEKSESIDSVLLVLNEPSWNRNKNKNPTGEFGACKENPDIFWGAEGVVRTFLDRVLESCTAPITNSRKDKSEIFSNPTREYLYLYIKDLDRLNILVGDQNPREFFRDLESTYVSDLISEVRIRVKLKKNDGSVTFRELSEGEQQLLTVLGLLRFTAEDESLFLLDEPDTHLNPRWSVDYIDYLNKFVTSGSKNESSSHIVLTTHNPIAIAELKKQQVQILHRDVDTRKITSREPDFDPRGMGYAGIITSDMFGLDTALDSHTHKLLERKRLITAKEPPLDTTEKLELASINEELDGYGFRYSSRDPIFEEYLKARYLHENNKMQNSTIADLNQQQKLEVSREIFKKVFAKLKEEQTFDEKN